MTFSVLRSLHAIIGEALDDIERVYTEHGGPSSPMASRGGAVAKTSSDHSDTGIVQEILTRPGHKPKLSTSHAYASPPPSPSMSTNPYFSPDIPPVSSAPGPIDFPSLDAPYNPISWSEALTSNPIVSAAISRIVSAAGQMSATVQAPFLSLCDASMGYHVPSCMRLLEASHVVEILRDSGPEGLHVNSISEQNGVDPTKLAHTLRLLATHHFLRETSPNVFALNRISSMLDSGKTFSELKQFQAEGRPEHKYSDTNGIAAFVGLCTDEIQKASAYMTETYYLSPSKDTRDGREPTRAPFCFAFDTVKTNTGFFGWLEGEIETKTSTPMRDEGGQIETGRGRVFPPALGKDREPKTPPSNRSSVKNRLRSKSSSVNSASSDSSTLKNEAIGNANRFRLERFGKAMSGTDSWEAPGAILQGFDWHLLPHGSVVVDVGGGIGSTSMLLATAFSSDRGGSALKFVIQDRPFVVEMGVKAWQAKCPELLDSSVQFKVHDFFTLQPIRNAAVFLLRVILHDWPEDFARNILLRLREAAMPETKLLIADFVLPLACPDEMGSNGELEGVEGAESILVPAPLLANLGKASANVYWMDLTMQVMFNAQERTLREIVALALSAGWKVTKVVKYPGSLFGHITAVPVPIPVQHRDMDSVTRPLEPSLGDIKGNCDQRIRDQSQRDIESEGGTYRGDLEIFGRASSRCGTPTFGSRTELSSMEEVLARFGGGVIRSRQPRGAYSGFSYIRPAIPLKPAVTLSSSAMKKRPSPLSVIPPSTMQASPKPSSSPLTKNSSPQHPAPNLIKRRMSLAHLRTPSRQGSIPDRTPSVVPPLPQSLLQPSPPSPMSPLHPHTPLTRRASHAQLSQTAGSHGQGICQAPASPSPSLIPVRSLTDVPTLSTPQRTQRVGHHRQQTPIDSPTPLPRVPPPISKRRTSSAQFPQVELRKRAGSVACSPLLRPISGVGVYSPSLNAGGVLRFDRLKGCDGEGMEEDRDRGHEGGGRSRGRSRTRSRSPVAGSVNVLAAAAMIERGEFYQPPASP